MTPLSTIGLPLLLLAFEWPGALDADARDMASTDDAQRMRAVERLSMRDMARVKPLLLPALSDRDPGIRLLAARVMARAAVPEAIEAATTWIVSPGTRDRPQGLQVLRDAAAFPPPARRATERALADGESTIRVQALEVLARQELGSSFSHVAAAIDDDNREVRLRAVRLLGEARDARASLPLLARLGDTDRQVRIESLRALGLIGDGRVTPALLRLLSDPNDDVRIGAIDALARLKAPAAVPPLATWARRRPTDDVARRAQLALGTIATPEAVAVLVTLGRDPPVGDELREALRRAGPAAVAPLVRELETGTPTSVAVAAWALGQIGDRRATPPLAAAIERPGSAAAPALAALAALADPTAVPALVRAASAPAADTRRLALEALTATGDDRALVVLPRGLADPDAGARVRAIRLVVALGARQLGPELARRLADPDAEVATEAALALGRLAADMPERERTPAPPGTAPAAPLAPVGPILTTLTRPAAAERGAEVLDALGDALERAARPEDAAAIGRALPAARGGARAAVARGLAAAHAERTLEDAAAIDQLIALIDEGGATALAAAEALGAARLPPGREAPLARAFGDAEPAVQARLCPALATTESGLHRLGALLTDRDQPEEVRAAAAWAAAGAPELGEALRRAASDPAPAVAANARAAVSAGPARRRGAWVGARLVAADGTPWPARWVVVIAGDGTEIWTLTDGGGRARVGDLPPGPYQLGVMDPALRVTPAASRR